MEDKEVRYLVRKHSNAIKELIKEVVSKRVQQPHKVEPG